MSNMLRKGASQEFGCCDFCARRKPPSQKPGPRERRLARAREKVDWKKDVRRDG